jgi:hypothetical protein
VHPWHFPGRYGWLGGTGTAAHLIPATRDRAVHPGRPDRAEYPADPGRLLGRRGGLTPGADFCRRPRLSSARDVIEGGSWAFGYLWQ